MERNSKKPTYKTSKKRWKTRVTQKRYQKERKALLEEIAQKAKAIYDSDTVLQNYLGEDVPADLGKWVEFATNFFKPFDNKKLKKHMGNTNDDEWYIVCLALLGYGKNE